MEGAVSFVGCHSAVKTNAFHVTDSHRPVTLLSKLEFASYALKYSTVDSFISVARGPSLSNRSVYNLMFTRALFSSLDAQLHLDKKAPQDALSIPTLFRVPVMAGRMSVAVSS